MGKGNATRGATPVAPSSTGAPPVATPVTRFDPFEGTPLAGQHALRDLSEHRAIAWSRVEIEGEIARLRGVATAVRSGGHRAMSPPGHWGYPYPLPLDHWLQRLGAALLDEIKRHRMKESRARAMRLAADGTVALADVLADPSLPGGLRFSDLECFGSSGLRVDIEVNAYGTAMALSELAELRASLALPADIRVRAVFLHSGHKAKYRPDQIRVSRRQLAEAVVIATARERA